MKKSGLLFLTIAAFALFVACSKDDDNTPAPQTRLQLLTSHGWRINTFYIDSVDVTNFLFSPCELDNIYTYNTNYNYTIDEGPTKCDPTNSQIVETGTWAFGNNENMLIYEPGTPGEATCDILQLDANTFKCRETFFDSTTMADVVYLIHFVRN